MKVCIFCHGQEGQVALKNKEHVIPQSFGKFGSQTPTLDCVCDPCNAFFAKTLDTYFARESLEGIWRYQKGIRSSEDRVQRHITIQLPDDPELGIFARTRVYIDGTTGQVVPLTYIRLKNISTGEELFLLRHEVNTFDPTSWVKEKIEIEIRAENTAEHDEIVKKLKAMGFPQKFGEMQGLPSEIVLRKQPPVQIEAQVNRMVRRAVTKILFNFAAKYIGADEVLKPSWDGARRFVREDVGDVQMKAENKPFWDDEDKKMRLQPAGYNVRLENMGNDVVGFIEFFSIW